MFGGYEFDITTFYKTMLEISTGHPGAGWCLTLCASHAWVVGSHWEEEGQRALFGPDGNFAAPHRAPPTGVATPVAGRLSRDRPMGLLLGHSARHAFRRRGARRRQRRQERDIDFRHAARSSSPCSTIGAATRRWACAPRAPTASRSRTSSFPNPTRPTAMVCGARRQPRRKARRARGSTATRCIWAAPRVLITCRW